MASPVQATIEEFIKALRASEVRVSPAEAIDAHRALLEIGYADRTLMRDALCVTLAKSEAEVDRFDEVFDAFFTRDAFRPQSRTSRPSDGPAAGGSPESPSDLPLAQMLLEGDTIGLNQAMEAAARSARSTDVRLNTQRNLLSRRILDEMGLRELEELIQRLREMGLPRDEALADRLAERREALFEEAGRFVDRQMVLYASETGRRMRESLLGQAKLTSVEPEEMRQMEALVKRMAKRLATRYSRKRHRADKGKLDVRKTIRKSMGYGGVPFDIVWKRETIEKPKIVAICDVSRSVAAAAQFMLLFLYSLNEVIEKLEAFAFSDRLIRVGDILEAEELDAAIASIIKKIGMRPTDYGRALADFTELHRDDLDRHTTVIILGDGRSNYANPRLDLMREISHRARAVIWLNPEPETYWNQGDSRMDQYARFCSVAKVCNTLNQLERIIEDVLRTYMPR
ncbi:MAG TPA: VWA domain-containing protein [Caulobacteraceae bacterium]|nr:VWA domain-containing protein [Caulobacteraceae bacterium]